jgi:acyl-CoA dehydrogenase
MTDSSLLADAVERFFGERCTPEDVAAVEAGASMTRIWSETEALGLTLTSVPEDLGGGGGSIADAMTVLRAAGRHAVPLPLAETILAGWLLSEAGLTAAPGPCTVAPVRSCDRLRLKRDGAGWRLSGRACDVPWADAADRIVVVATDEECCTYVASVDPSSARIEPGHNLAVEPRDVVEFAEVRLDAGACTPLPRSSDTIQLRGALARAAMMLGALESVRDLTIAHAKSRVQFGRPIARFQAVQHLIAQIARDVAVTRAAVDLAVAGVADDPAVAWVEAAAAKVVAGRAAWDVSMRAHQVHGAIGITKEYPLSTLTRRLWSWRDEFGSAAEWSRRIGAEAWTAEGGRVCRVAGGQADEPREPARGHARRAGPGRGPT